MSKTRKYSQDTILTQLGRDPDDYYGLMNPPIVQASTIKYKDLESYETKKGQKFTYANIGHPLSHHFETAMAELEGGYRAVSSSTGLAPITASLLAFLKSGDHLLMCDSIYPPTRIVCEKLLKKFGVEIEYYDPLIGASIKDLIKDNTAVIYLESPGSATFEVQDVPAITEVAKDAGVITIMDNTWASGLLFKPLAHGVNISVCAATKYIGGHADVNLGYAVADTEENYKRLKAAHVDLGHCPGSEDLYLALRGLRTMKMRLEHCAKSALKVAQFLQTRPEVRRVYHVALPEHTSHEIWKRDFTGANGLLSFVLEDAPKPAVAGFMDALELFPIGSSWGGYMSLLQPQIEINWRKAVKWQEEGTLIRLQIGLEDPDDLITDLGQAFEKFGDMK
ncbi:MAG: cystathionine beta-lyase [Alphaproteobacteria bacterium]|nr:cystathionine beta-lyase [Alphaproteobacteria bacterium]